MHTLYAMRSRLLELPLHSGDELSSVPVPFQRYIEQIAIFIETNAF